MFSCRLFKTGLISTCAFGAATYLSIPTTADCRNQQRNVILVTSTNIEKLNAVHRAFTDEAPNPQSIEYEIRGCEANSGIYHGQPWGLQQTFEGALCRLNDVRHRLSDFEYSDEVSHIVSVENGVEVLVQHHGNIGLDFACVIVYCMESGREYIAFSQGRPYPIEQIQNMKRNGISNAQIGKFCSEYYESCKLPISRADQVYQATSICLQSTCEASSLYPADLQNNTK